jgi:REP element-mobilizing transposase RayT
MIFFRKCGNLAAFGEISKGHVHLVATPRRADALAETLRHTHGRYASYLNARKSATGHVWQGRYYSCPLDTAHLWAALRYTELNPVRAGMGAAERQEVSERMKKYWVARRRERGAA